MEELAKRKVAATNIMAAATPATLGKLAEMADSKQHAVPVRRVYELVVKDITDGLELIKTGKVRGKLGIKLM